MQGVDTVMGVVSVAVAIDEGNVSSFQLEVTKCLSSLGRASHLIHLECDC